MVYLLVFPCLIQLSSWVTTIGSLFNHYYYFMQILITVFLASDNSWYVKNCRKDPVYKSPDFTAQLSHKCTTVNMVLWMILIFSHRISSKLFFCFVFKFVQVLWLSVPLSITLGLNRNIFIVLNSHERKKKSTDINNDNNGRKPNTLMHSLIEHLEWFWKIPPPRFFFCFK